MMLVVLFAIAYAATTACAFLAGTAWVQGEIRGFVTMLTAMVVGVMLTVSLGFAVTA